MLAQYLKPGLASRMRFVLQQFQSIPIALGHLCTGVGKIVLGDSQAFNDGRSGSFIGGGQCGQNPERGEWPAVDLLAARRNRTEPRSIWVRLSQQARCLDGSLIVRGCGL